MEPKKKKTKTKTKPKTKTKQPSAAKKPSRAKASGGSVAALLAPHGFPTKPGPGLCFEKGDDERFARGYPAMRMLTDEPIADADAAAQVESALDAIDPVFGLRVPRAIARRFLLGYHAGPLLFVGAGTPPDNARKRIERAAAIRSDRAIDVEMLDETLDRHGWGMGSDTYARWRLPKVLFLYEELLGTEPVARATTRFLVSAARDVPRWELAGTDPYRTNASPHYIALAMPALLSRVPAEVARDLRAELARTRRPETAGEEEPRAFFGLLHALAAPEATPDPYIESLQHQLALSNGDAAAIGARLDRLPNELIWYPARICWLLGTERFAGKLNISGHLLPRLVDQISPIRDPAIVRLVAKVATQRAGKAAAAGWLREHAGYARPILESLTRADDDKERAAAETALELCTAKIPAVAAAPLDDDALEAETANIFEALGKKLRATKKKSAQVAAIQDAYERYTEARAAAGDPIPEAYFTHRFGDFGLGEWGMLAAESIE